VLFPPEQVYHAIIKEILEVRVKRQIGRSNPRTVKNLKGKYRVLSKSNRIVGMFGYSKKTAVPHEIFIATRAKQPQPAQSLKVSLSKGHA